MAQHRDNTTYTQMGMAALLPGMQHLIELMQGELDRMRTTLEQLQSGEAPVKKDGRGSTYWAAMTPEQRSIEMKKRWRDRAAKANGNAVSGGGWDKFKTVAARSKEIKRRMKMRQKGENPRARVARKGMKNYWAKMTPAQRSVEILRRKAVAANGAAV